MSSFGRVSLHSFIARAALFSATAVALAGCVGSSAKDPARPDDAVDDPETQALVASLGTVVWSGALRNSSRTRGVAHESPTTSLLECFTCDKWSHVAESY